MNPLLETKGITMLFGGFTANDHIDFCCNHGSVISLLGENGAGKTTLMRVIYGIYRPQEGELFFEGKRVSIQSPRDAIALGIQMVHQHFMLVDHLSVAENIVMGNEPKKYGLYQRKKAEEAVLALSQEYGLMIDPSVKVGDLSVGEKQRTEIIKALYHGAKLLILDEPTAVLTPQETQELFKIIRKLKNDGRSVILITHKLHETMEIADEIHVMRHGKMVGQVKKEETDTRQLTRMMVSHELAPIEKKSARLGETVLSMQSVSMEAGQENCPLVDFSLSIRAGEIYGMAGIEGNGQRELVEVISGIEKRYQGVVSILGQDTKALSTKEIIQLGVGCVHADRHERGLLLGLDAKQNMLLGYQFVPSMHMKSGLLKRNAYAAMAQHVFQKYRVSPNNIHSTAASFSGGNQQKIVVGREFYRNPKLAIIAHPTRGVDVGVSEVIHQSILDLRENGSAILLITADFDELFKLSDTIGVLYEGKLAIEGAPDTFTPNRLGYYMGGGGKHDET